MRTCDLRSWLLGFALAAGGCNCGKTTPTLQGEIGIPQAPASLNFGHVALGQTVRLQLPLSNTGAGTLDISSQAVSGPPFAESTVFSPPQVSAGSHSTAMLAFTPTAAGAASGTFTIGDDGNPTQVVVALTGVGLDLSLSVTPVSLSFGQIPVGSSAPGQTVTFENTTTAPIYVTFDTGSTATEYTVKDSAGSAVTTTPVELMPNSPYALTVGFTPDAVSIFNSALSYTPCADATTATCLTAQSVTLSGQGVSGLVTLTPNPLVFSEVPEGTSATEAITVTNTGNASATVGCVYLSSQGQVACLQASPSFTIGTPSSHLPTTLPGGGSLTIPITYQSSGTTTATDVLNALWVAQGGNTNQTASANLQGSAGPPPCSIALTPPTLNLTYTSAGVPVAGNITVVNTSAIACQVTGIALDATSDPGFALATGQATSLSLPVGSDAGIGVTFTLAANALPSTRLGYVDFQSTDPLHANVKVSLVASATSLYAGGGAWPRWHHDAYQTGLSYSDTSRLVGSVAWTFNVGVPPTNTITGVAYDYLNSPVVGSDGTVYQLGLNGTLYAVNPDGGQAWATPLESPVNDPHPGTPIILADGTLYVAFGDTLMGGQMYGLFHVSASGSILEEIPPISGSDGFDLPPLLTNAGLLLGADDIAVHNEQGAFGFQIDDGGLTLLATTSIEGAQLADGVSAVVGPTDVTYWCTGGSCFALSAVASGFAVLPGWPVQPGGTLSMASDLSLDALFTGNLMVLLGGWQVYDGTQSQQVVSINPSTGAVAWNVTLPAPPAADQNPSYNGLGDATVGNSCPAIGTDGTVYVGNFDGLHALNGSTGVEKAGWPFVTNSDVLTAPAIGGDGTIFFGTADGSFYAVHPNGSLRFKVSAGGRVAGSPAIAPDGTVYFTADDGNLYAVK